MADILAKLTFLVWWEILPKLDRPWPTLERAYDYEAQWHTDATTEQTLISLWADAHRLSYVAWAWNTASCEVEPALITAYDGTPTNFSIGFRDHLLAIDSSDSEGERETD